MTQTVFENIYNKYAALLYGIALEICPDEAYAEQVFITTFKNIYDHNKTGQNSPSYYVEIIKLILAIAKLKVYPNVEKVNFKLKQFDITPLLQQLICNEDSLDNYCDTHKISKQDGLQIMRNEFETLKNLKTKYLEKIVLA